MQCVCVCLLFVRLFVWTEYDNNANRCGRRWRWWWRRNWALKQVHLWSAITYSLLFSLLFIYYYYHYYSVVLKALRKCIERERVCECVCTRTLFTLYIRLVGNIRCLSWHRPPHWNGPYAMLFVVVVVFLCLSRSRSRSRSVCYLLYTLI